MKNNKNALILGAGLTGLRTALYLINSGFNVTIIEKTDKVGGVCASFKYKDFKSLVPNYLTIKKKNSIRLLGQYFDFPVKLSQLLMRIPLSKAFNIFIDFVKSNLSRNEIKNYEDYFVKGFGRTGYNTIFKGFAEKVWGNPQKLSKELAIKRSPVGNIFDVLKSMLIKNKDVSAEFFYYPKIGYGEIGENIAKQITKKGGKILFNSYAKKINLKEDNVESLEVSIKGKIKKLKADVLVSSIPITDLPGLLFPKTPNNILDSASKLKFRSMIISYVFLKKEKALNDNWIFFPEREFFFNRVAELKSFSPFVSPKDRTVLTAEITCDYNDEIYNLPEEKIKEKVLKDLEKANLIKKDEVIDFITRKAGRVYPVYSLDSKENLNKVLDFLDKIGNIYTTGRPGLFNYNNADHCLDMAKVVSDIIIKQKPRSEWKKARDYFDSYRIVD